MTAGRRSWVADPDRIVVAGPLAEYVCGLRTEAVRLGFVQSSVGSQLQMMAQLSQWLADAGLDPAQATPEMVQEFVQARRRRGYTDAVSRQGLGPLLRYLRSKSIIPPAVRPAVDTPIETLLAQFGDYLVRERGLAAKTCATTSIIPGSSYGLCPTRSSRPLRGCPRRRSRSSCWRSVARAVSGRRRLKPCASIACGRALVAMAAARRSLRVAEPVVNAAWMWSASSARMVVCTCLPVLVIGGDVGHVRRGVAGGGRRGPPCERVESAGHVGHVGVTG